MLKRIIRTAIATLLIAGIAFSFGFPVLIDGTSMQPTIEDNSFGFVVRSWLHADVKRGDIVSIIGDDNRTYWVKRVIGLPGDVIEEKAGVVYVNGEKIEEDYVAEPDFESIFNYKYTVGEDEIFVLGDNRLYSYDCSLCGPLPMENLVGFWIGG